MSSRKLEWGQTPFDECTREELIQHCARLYSATTALSSVAQMVQDESLFWTKGSGAVAVEKGRQAIESAQNGYEAENIHNAYLRYAADLLFAETPDLEVRNGWVICSVCKQVVSSCGGSSNAGKACREVIPLGCTGVLHELSWDDLKRNF